MLVAALVMGSCGTTRDTERINSIEIGMTKDKVRKLLGLPKYRNACDEGEEWGYRKYVGKNVDIEEVLFVVTFDENEQVIGYETVQQFPRLHHPNNK